MLQPRRCALSTLAQSRRLQYSNAQTANVVRSEKAVAPIRGTDVSLQGVLFQSTRLRSHVKATWLLSSMMIGCNYLVN